VTKRTRLSHARATRLAMGTTYQKVFQNERTFRSRKRPTPLAAANFLFWWRGFCFNPHELILRAAVRALERCCFGDRHDVVRFEA
jgi:hypothetical protein